MSRVADSPSGRSDSAESRDSAADLRPGAGEADLDGAGGAVAVADADVGRSYDARAEEYLAVAGDIGQMDRRDRDTIARWRDETPGSLLDAGCGPGHWTAFLQQGGREVSGVDLSAAFIRSARSRYPDLVFRRGSFRALPLPAASVSGVLAWYSLIHTVPADVPAVLTEFARILKPGGGLLLGFFVGPPREQFAHAIATAYFWSAESLSPMLADAGLQMLWHETRDREPGEVSARPHGALCARRV